MRWSSPRAIVVIFMVRSSHLGQVLLRERMPLLALFLNLMTPRHQTKRSGKEDSTQHAHDRRQSRRNGTAGGASLTLVH